MVCLFIRKAPTARAIVTVLNDIIRGASESGRLKPMVGSRVFINSPNSIMKEILSPVDRTIFIIRSSLVNFSIWSMRKPGIKVRKKNPAVCLKTGMLIITTILTMMVKQIIRLSHFVGDNSICCFNILPEFRFKYLTISSQTDYYGVGIVKRQ
ncbi:hypothetical protein ACFLTB_03525 [Chloroflexota bacterium]